MPNQTDVNRSKLRILYCSDLMVSCVYRHRVQVEANRVKAKSPTTPEAPPIALPPRSPRVSSSVSPSASGNEIRGGSRSFLFFNYQYNTKILICNKIPMSLILLPCARDSQGDTFDLESCIKKKDKN